MLIALLVMAAGASRRVGRVREAHRLSPQLNDEEIGP